MTPLKAVHNLHHLALVNQRAGIVGEVAFDKLPDPVDFIFWNRGLAFERHDVDDAGALEHRKPVPRVEPREAVSGKERPVDLLLPSPSTGSTG